MPDDTTIECENCNWYDGGYDYYLNLCEEHTQTHRD